MLKKCKKCWKEKNKLDYSSMNCLKSLRFGYYIFLIFICFFFSAKWIFQLKNKLILGELQKQKLYLLTLREVLLGLEFFILIWWKTPLFCWITESSNKKDAKLRMVWMILNQRFTITRSTIGSFEKTKFVWIKFCNNFLRLLIPSIFFWFLVTLIYKNQKTYINKATPKNDIFNLVSGNE